MTKIWRSTLMAVILLGGVPGYATTPHNAQAQSLQSITNAAKETAVTAATAQGYDNVLAEVRPLDQRLKLPRCEKPLETFMPRAGQVIGSISVGVKCSGEKPWTIYVRTSIKAQQTIPVLASPLPRNRLIQNGDLHTISVDMSQLPSDRRILLDAQQILGKETTRPLTANTPIRYSDLRAPDVIKRGQAVTLVSSTGNLEVRVQGKAMKDAGAGELLTVVNLSSGKSVEGIANTDGSVSVP